jgi:hypothetical protein
MSNTKLAETLFLYGRIHIHKLQEPILILRQCLMNEKQEAEKILKEYKKE